MGDNVQIIGKVVSTRSAWHRHSAVQRTGRGLHRCEQCRIHQRKSRNSDAFADSTCCLSASPPTNTIGYSESRSHVIRSTLVSCLYMPRSVAAHESSSEQGAHDESRSCRGSWVFWGFGHVQSVEVVHSRQRSFPIRRACCSCPPSRSTCRDWRLASGCTFRAPSRSRCQQHLRQACVHGNLLQAFKHLSQIPCMLFL